MKESENETVNRLAEGFNRERLSDPFKPRTIAFWKPLLAFASIVCVALFTVFVVGYHLGSNAQIFAVFDPADISGAGNSTTLTLEPVTLYRDCINVGVLAVDGGLGVLSQQTWRCKEWGEPYSRDSRLATH